MGQAHLGRNHVLDGGTYGRHLAKTIEQFIMLIFVATFL